MSGSYRWTLKSADGSTLRSSEVFDSQSDAESWLAGYWMVAVEEGADNVVLMSGNDAVYEMSLHPAEQQ